MSVSSLGILIDQFLKRFIGLFTILCDHFHGFTIECQQNDLTWILFCKATVFCVTKTNDRGKMEKTHSAILPFFKRIQTKAVHILPPHGTLFRVQAFCIHFHHIKCIAIKAKENQYHKQINGKEDQQRNKGLSKQAQKQAHNHKYQRIQQAKPDHLRCR